MDFLRLFRQASDHTAQMIDQVRESQYDDPTPCSDWNVRQLLEHMIGGLHTYASLVAAVERPPPDDPLGEGPGSAYRSGVAAMVDAYTDPAAMERMVQSPAGEVPGARLLPVFFSEAVFHGWDLATATSQDATIPEELGPAILAVAEMGAETGRANGVYGPAVAVPDDASDGVRALGLVGRRG